MSQSLLLDDTRRPAEFAEGIVLFAGAATVILRYGGFTVLVDPCFLHHGDHVHLGYNLAASGLGPSELGDAIERLPALDFAMVPQLQDGHAGRVDRELDRRLPVLATRSAASTLRRKGFVAARSLATWETIEVARAGAAVQVTAVPAQGPVSSESFLPDAVGSILEFAGADKAVRLRAFVSADSIVHGDLREIRRRGVDLALIPVGGTRVLALLAGSDPGVTTVRLVAPRVPAPARDDRERAESPVEEFAGEARRAGLETRVEYVEPGAGYAFTPPALQAAREDTLRAVPHRAAHAVGTPEGDRPVAA